MNRRDFQIVANLRIKEAKVLLDSRCFEGAYYLAGYSIECALKSCIAKQIRRYDFPDKKLITDSYTHDIEKLLSISGLKFEHQRELQSNPAFAINWAIVKDWSEQARYQTSVSEAEAKDLYKAVSQRNYGVLRWVKKWW